MKRTGKILSVVMSMALLAPTLAAGCGPAGNADDKKYVLTIGYDAGGYGQQWLENAVTAFCEEEGIERSKVLIEAEKGYTTTLAAKLEASTAIRDVCITEESTQRQWAAMGYLEPLDDVFEMTLSTGETVESVLSPGYKEFGYLNNVHGEHYYLFPFTQGAGGLYYNKTLFTEKGWNVPTTYDELITLCKRIYADEVADQPNKDQQIYPFICSADITAYWDFLVENWWVQLLGIDNFETFCEFESAELFNPEGIYAQAKLGALEAFQNLVVKDEKTGTERTWVINDSADYTAAQMLFVQGKAAMMPNGAWLESEVSASMPDGMEIALMPTPILDGAKTDENGDPIKVNFNCSANSIFIPKAAAHKDMAKKFIAFMCEPDMVADFISEAGSPRPLKVDISKVEGLTTCQQSIIDVWSTSQNFAFKTTSVLSNTGRAGVWMKGYPYGAMMFKDSNGKQMTAAEYINAEYAYCATEWSNWLADANL